MSALLSVIRRKDLNKRPVRLWYFPSIEDAPEVVAEWAEKRLKKDEILVRRVTWHSLENAVTGEQLIAPERTK